MNVIQILNLGLWVILPLLIYKHLRERTHRFKDSDFRDRFGDTTDSLTPRRQNSPIYLLCFCLTRLVVVCIVVFTEQAWLQITVTILTIKTQVIV